MISLWRDGMEATNMMTHNSGGMLRKALTRVLAAGALLAIYAVSTIAVSGVFVATSTTEAQARGRGRGRGYYRGRGRGYYRGRGYWRGGFFGVGPLCHNPWSSRRYYCF
jgi:hypothetical protein